MVWWTPLPVDDTAGGWAPSNFIDDSVSSNNWPELAEARPLCKDMKMMSADCSLILSSDPIDIVDVGAVFQLVLEDNWYASKDGDQVMVQSWCPMATLGLVLVHVNFYSHSRTCLLFSVRRGPWIGNGQWLPCGKEQQNFTEVCRVWLSHIPRHDHSGT